MGVGKKNWGGRDLYGIDWLPMMVDAAGHLQVDVLSVGGTVTVEDTVYKTAYEFVAGELIYIGWAAAGVAQGDATWRIKKYTWSAGLPTKSEFADGVDTFTKEWDLRDGYGYSS